MRTKYIAVVAIVFNALAVEAQAVTVRGASSCGEWVQETQNRGNGKPDDSSAFWILGYLSGRAEATGKDAVKGTDSLSIYAWINNYCRVNPLDNVSEAGSELFKELIRRKGL